MQKPPLPKTTAGLSHGMKKTRRRHMFRTYIRVYDAQRRQHAVPVGWWYPDCHAFMDDLR